jgi:general stress protein YciG
MSFELAPVPEDDVDARIRRHMRKLGRSGGMATAKRARTKDPTFYRDIGRMGGKASWKARQAAIARDLEQWSPSGALVFAEPIKKPGIGGDVPALSAGQAARSSAIDAEERALKDERRESLIDAYRVVMLRRASREPSPVEIREMLSRFE